VQYGKKKRGVEVEKRVEKEEWNTAILCPIFKKGVQS